MARSHFETLANFLKAHPGARPVNTRRRGASTNHAAPKRPKDYGPPDPDRHRRKCTICRHPHRLDIERDYLRWRSTADIARDFGIFDHSSICRHARATGLQRQRFRLIAYALHPLLEQSEDLFVKATPSSIISAVRTYAQINDEGRKIRSKPITKVYIVDPRDESASRPAVSASQTGAKRPTTNLQPKRAPANSSHSPLATSHCLSNRPIQELEDDSTH